ncbi:hypothetical protein D3C87_609470 [compost metagenome]
MRKISIVITIFILLCGCSFSSRHGRYTPEQAEQNGDVVNLRGSFKNLGKWYKFRYRVSQSLSQEVSLRITQYTTRGRFNLL